MSAFLSEDITKAVAERKPNVPQKPKTYFEALRSLLTVTCFIDTLSFAAIFVTMTAFCQVVLIFYEVWRYLPHLQAQANYWHVFQWLKFILRSAIRVRVVLLRNTIHSCKRLVQYTYLRNFSPLWVRHQLMAIVIIVRFKWTGLKIAWQNRLRLQKHD